PGAGRALHKALAFIRAAVDGGPIPSLIAFDPSFRPSFPPSKGRREIKLRTGVDIGYDLGDDRWVAFCGLLLLPSGEEGLVRDFAHMAARGQVGRRFRFFLDQNRFPADTDCTALAGYALYKRGLIPADGLVGIARELLLATAPAEPPPPPESLVRPGVPMVYWHDGAEPDALPRSRSHDPVVSANVLCVLLEARRLGLRDADGAIDATRRYVAGHLLSDAYRNGSRYYPAPEAFLFAASRLVKGFPEYRAELAGPLAEAIAGRDAEHRAHSGGNPRTALNVALRMLAAHNLGLRDGQEPRLRTLLRQQGRDGSWPALPCFTLGRLPVYSGSPVLSTLFAAAAIHVSLSQGAGD
ncbi:hypothetical protein, partial [Actinomadura rubrisoli]|uniref:hypothetical protein n=1 Tax=Actinomadura rubrisoli TaxID=2530368 RepID=UPI0014048838